MWPNVDLDERFDPVIAWHNPDPDYMGAPIEGATNVMTAPWFDPALTAPIRTGTGAMGALHDALAAGKFEWLQLLIHPAIWVYDGGTMGETMQSFLDADRAVRLEHCGLTDQPLMKPITVVVTASGAPGTAALLHGLRANGEQRCGSSART